MIERLTGRPPGTPAEQLRAATWPTHVRLERALAIEARLTRLPAYREHLSRMWGFCRALEDSIDPEVLVRALPDADERRKTPLLTRDLVSLGLAPERIDSLPRPALARREETAAALGASYVLEGATRGGRVLLPLVTARLGLAAEAGAAFFASYGDEADTRWRTFVGAVDAWCDSQERVEAAVGAAVATFDALYVWLVGGSGHD